VQLKCFASLNVGWSCANTDSVMHYCMTSHFLCSCEWQYSSGDDDSCVICHEQYVGQTKNKFSTRWSSHRSNWNRPNYETDENSKALSRHFSESHGNVNKPPIPESYIVTFVENLISFLRISVKISGITNVTHKLIFKTWPSQA